MHAQRFDRWTQSLAALASRRTVTWVLSTGVAGARFGVEAGSSCVKAGPNCTCGGEPVASCMRPCNITV